MYHPLLALSGLATIIGGVMGLSPMGLRQWFSLTVVLIGAVLLGASFARSRLKATYYGAPAPDVWRLNWWPGRFNRLRPVSRLTPLRECARVAYSKTRGSNAAGMAERQRGEAGALGWYAYALVTGREGAPLFAQRVPGTEYEVIPESELSQLTFVEDFRALAEKSTLEIRYQDLRVDRADLRKQIRKIRSW